MNPPPLTNAVVRVMRSHDYCHFEVTLSASNGEAIAIHNPGDPRGERESIPTPLDVRDVDELRKTAARLVDKAIEQYKVKKAALQLGDSYAFAALQRERDRIMLIPETERSVDHLALCKKVADREHAMKYDYEDQWAMPDED
jgi:uncharacterized protein with PIN domain